jgi:hypothetical protein
MNKYLLLLAVLLLSINTRADTLVDVSSVTCETCWGSPSSPSVGLPQVTLDLQMTVAPVTGTFYIPYFNFTETGTFDEVESISGTLNGDPVSISQPPQGGSDYLWPGTFALGYVCFTVDANPYCAWTDDAYNLLSLPATFEPITWSATDPVATPEPATWWLLPIGFGALLGWKLRRRKLT